MTLARCRRRHSIAVLRESIVVVMNLFFVLFFRRQTAVWWMTDYWRPGKRVSEATDNTKLMHSMYSARSTAEQRVSACFFSSSSYLLGNHSNYVKKRKLSNIWPALIDLKELTSSNLFNQKLYRNRKNCNGNWKCFLTNFREAKYSYVGEMWKVQLLKYLQESRNIKFSIFNFQSYNFQWNFSPH